MITLQCSVGHAMMKSNSTLMLATFLLAKAFGTSSILVCMAPLPTLSDFRFTFMASSMSLGIRMVSRLSRRSFKMLQNVTPLSLPPSKPIRSIQSLQGSSLSRLSLQICVTAEDRQVKAQTERFCHWKDVQHSTHCQ